MGKKKQGEAVSVSFLKKGEHMTNTTTYRSLRVIGSLLLQLSIYCLPVYLIAQTTAENLRYRFDCPSGFYQLNNNQVQKISTALDGSLQWQAVGPIFNRSLKGLAYHHQEGYFYSLDTNDYTLIRINRYGICHAIGRPVHHKSSKPLTVFFETITIADNFFVGYHAASKKFYWVDLGTNTYEITDSFGHQVLHNMFYDAQSRLIWTLGGDNVLYAMHPKIRRFWPQQHFLNLAQKSKDPRGNLWRSQSGRFFVSREQGRQLFELNPETKLVYAFKNLLTPTEGDATACSNALPPVFIQEDVLELFIEALPSGALQLKWTAVREWSNTAYVVQRSTDGQNWRDLKIISSAGEHEYQNPYGHVFWPQKNELNWFRLLKKDHYHQTNYSRVLAYPNPLNAAFVEAPFAIYKQQQGRIQLRGYEQQQVYLLLKDVYGSVMRQREVKVYDQDCQISWPFSGLNSGVYTLEIIAQNTVKRWSLILFKLN